MAIHTASRPGSEYIRLQIASRKICFLSLLRFFHSLYPKISSMRNRTQLHSKWSMHRSCIPVNDALSRARVFHNCYRIGPVSRFMSYPLATATTVKTESITHLRTWYYTIPSSISPLSGTNEDFVVYEFESIGIFLTDARLQCTTKQSTRNKSGVMWIHPVSWTLKMVLDVTCGYVIASQRMCYPRVLTLHLLNRRHTTCHISSFQLSSPQPVHCVSLHVSWSNNFLSGPTCLFQWNHFAYRKIFCLLELPSRIVTWYSLLLHAFSEIRSKFLRWFNLQKRGDENYTFCRFLYLYLKQRS